MSFKYSVPNEQQAEVIKACGMNPQEYAVTFATEEYFQLQHYKTGNEITICPNRLKKARG